MGRRNVPVPGWATDLTVRASEEFGFACPPITWDLKPSQLFSSGRMWPTRIHVTAGTSLLDQGLVLMHELAHWITPPGYPAHGAVFWRNAWRLFRWVGLPDEYAMARSQRYMTTAATIGTREFGVPTDPEPGRTEVEWMRREHARAPGTGQ